MGFLGGHISIHQGQPGRFSAYSITMILWVYSRDRMDGRREPVFCLYVDRFSTSYHQLSSTPHRLFISHPDSSPPIPPFAENTPRACLSCLPATMAPNPASNLCTSTACLQLAADMKQSMALNYTKIDPCEDFEQCKSQ